MCLIFYVSYKKKPQKKILLSTVRIIFVSIALTAAAKDKAFVRMAVISAILICLVTGLHFFLV